MNQDLLHLSTDSPKKARKARLPKDPNAPRKPRKLSAMQQTLIKHVAGMSGNFNPSVWKEQGKFYSTLSKKYGADFLLWVGPPENFKVQTLLFYHTVLGKNYLSDQLLEYAKFKGVSQEKKQEVTLSPTKIGNDIQMGSKPKTLKDFLNYGKETRTPDSISISVNDK